MHGSTAVVLTFGTSASATELHGGCLHGSTSNELLVRQEGRRLSAVRVVCVCAAAAAVKGVAALVRMTLLLAGLQCTLKDT